MKKVTFIAPDNFGWYSKEVVDLFAKAGKLILPEQLVELGMQIKDDQGYLDAHEADIDGPNLPDDWDDVDPGDEHGASVMADVDQQRDDLADAVKDSIKDVVGRFFEVDVDNEKYEDVLEYLAYNFSPRMEDRDLDTIS